MLCGKYLWKKFQDFISYEFLNKNVIQENDMEIRVYCTLSRIH